MSHIVWNGCRVHVEDSGEDRPVIFMVHGWAQSSRCWDPVVSRLRPDYRIVTVDLPGFGNSDKPHEFKYAVEDLALLVADVMHHRNLRDVHLMGHSMGGAVSLLTSLISDRVRSMSLVNAPIEGPHLPLKLAAGAVMSPVAQFAFKLARQNRLALRLGALYATGHWMGDHSWVMKDIDRALPEAVVRCGRNLARLNLTQAARQVRVPTLVVGTDGDLVVPLAATRKLARLIPNAAPPVIISGVRHMPMVDAPEALAQAVKKFVEIVT